MIEPIKSKFEEILHSPVATGVALFVASAMAMIMANSGLSDMYVYIQNIPVVLGVGNWVIDYALYLWVNEALMALFFLLVGMEIKQEFITGHLSCAKQRVLPLFAMLGGLVVPIAFYMAVNMDSPDTLNGWAIPAATDIAFALGVMAMFGKRVPVGLKVCLVAIAVMDDLAAIVIIALFYGGALKLVALVLAGVFTAMAFYANYKNVTHLSVYLVLGAFIWFFILKAGVHATLAGVITGLAIPLRVKDCNGDSPLLIAEHELRPWVNFGVIPLFAFINAGVSLVGVQMDTLGEPVTLGIIMGLALGKPIGILAFSGLCVALGWSTLPDRTTWLQYTGMALLTGMGFTMSYFIGGLALDEMVFGDSVRLGVLVGTVTSGVLGALLLWFATRDVNPNLADK